MAAFNFGPKIRPCIVDEKKALFHCWSQESEIIRPSPLKGGHSGGVVAGTFGIVEFENGDVCKVYPEKITFLDNGIFKEYVFIRDEDSERINEWVNTLNNMRQEKRIKDIIHNVEEEKENDNGTERKDSV